MSIYRGKYRDQFVCEQQNIEIKLCVNSKKYYGRIRDVSEAYRGRIGGISGRIKMYQDVLGHIKVVRILRYAN
jgi:hypothetical protein